MVGAGMHIPMVTRAVAEIFGRDWYERGFMKAVFTRPMHDGDDVRVVLEEATPGPGDQRLMQLRIEKRDGEVPLSGFVGLTDSNTPPWQRAGEPPPISNLSEYDPLPLDTIGQVYAEKSMEFPGLESLSALRVVGDASTWYSGASPWGGAILPTHRFVKVPRVASDFRPSEEVARDMRAAMNVVFQVLHQGPVFADQSYRVQATLIAKGFSGRTAHRTAEASFRDDDGRTVALVRQTQRWFATARANH